MSLLPENDQGLERFNIQAQLERLSLKYPGTGTADTTKEEWITNIHKDTIARALSDWAQLAYIAAAQGTSVGKVKYDLMMKYHNPLAPDLTADEELARCREELAEWKAKCDVAGEDEVERKVKHARIA